MNSQVMILNSKRISFKSFRRSNKEWETKIVELFEIMNEYIPAPERDVDKPFLMPIEDVFSITGRGTVATGRVERGQLKFKTKLK